MSLHLSWSTIVRLNSKLYFKKFTKECGIQNQQKFNQQQLALVTRLTPVANKTFLTCELL